MLHGNMNAFYTLDASDYFGIAAGAPGDIDGDGVADLIVGASNDDDGGTNTGAVYVLFLETGGSIKNAQKLSNLYGNLNAFYTLDASDQLGYSLAGLGGDINGDSIVDIVVGAHFDDDGGTEAGAIYLVYLETNGNAKTVLKLSMSYGNFNAFYTLKANDRFGMSQSALGDIDGDSVNDLAVGAYYDNDGGTGAGAVYVLFLETDGSTKNAQKISNLYGNFGAFYTTVGDYFGNALAALGDVDGDFLLDLAVGCYYDDDGGTYAGSFFVLFLETDGTVKGAQKVSMSYGSFSTFYTLDTVDYFGWCLAALGDLDGNGVGDLAVGSRKDDDGGTNTGAVYVLYLNTDGAVSAAQKLSNLYGNMNSFYAIGTEDWFGVSVAALGDIDGNGVMDLAVGALLDDDGSSGAGSMYVVNLQQTYCETVSPTLTPTAIPLPIPSAQPTLNPSLSPSLHPSTLPVPVPTAIPTSIPTALPLPIPSAQPSLHPSLSPSLHPSMLPVPECLFRRRVLLSFPPCCHCPSLRLSRHFTHPCLLHCILRCFHYPSRRRTQRSFQRRMPRQFLQPFLQRKWTGAPVVRATITPRRLLVSLVMAEAPLKCQ